MSITATSSYASSNIYQSPLQTASSNTNQSSPFASLAQSDPALAKQLQGFADQLNQMKQQGASAAQIQQSLQSDFSQLTSTQLSEMKTAMANAQPQGTSGTSGTAKKHHHHHFSADSSSSNQSATSIGIMGGQATDSTQTPTASSIISNMPIANPAVAGLAAALA